MTHVRKMKSIHYRHDDDVAEYIAKVKKISPDVSNSSIVDCLVRYAIEQLGGEVRPIQFRAEIVPLHDAKELSIVKQESE